MEKLHWGFPDGNISDLIERRRLDSFKGTNRNLQFHSSLVQRLALEKEMEGHLGCVNAIAWNSKGSLLISGSDDTKINIWNYTDKKLRHSINTGHSTNIFCTRFVPETSDEVVVSGAGDAEVRVFNLSRVRPSVQEVAPVPAALYRCHTRRVKKLAVEVGNPNVVWSASEDGTFRQHDFRECSSCPPAGSTTQECRNILIDLRSGAKKSLAAFPRQCLSLKSCDISPTRPHQILVGGSDAFARLYDRRMLPPLSSCRTTAKPPPYVNYFCPVHLAEPRRSSLHLTHVAFSPNGDEVLLSYSGEHVYLMDLTSDSGKNAMRYSVGDIQKCLYVPPFPAVPYQPSSWPSISVKPSTKYSLQKLEVRKKLVQFATKCLDNLSDYSSDYLYGIDACNEVLDGKGPDIGSSLRHDCLCIRAALLLKRKWKNDAYMAIRDCNSARLLDASSFRAHFHMAEALLQLGRLKDAMLYANASSNLVPSNSDARKNLDALKESIATAEAQKGRRLQEDGTSNEVNRARIRSLSDVLLAASNMSGQSSQREEEEEENEYFSDYDNEMELDFDASVSGEDTGGNEIDSGVVRGSLSVLLHRGSGDSGKDESVTNVSSSDDSLSQPEVAVDMKQRYVGHCNVGTDIKQASFLGQRGEFIASGSDDGRWFIWEKQTGRLVKMLAGDEAVVNCIQAHPFDCAVATSGIDNTIKIWTPIAEVASRVAGGAAGPEMLDVLKAMQGNQRQLSHSREIMLPLELLERIRMHEFAESLECTQS
ncbi:WD and tetratricopeptide repeats protein 1 isoform X2 [Carex littledalei]|uniref:WD and tetratricopeptide repeats protein 1 isoform X2 n=1 Tax=Carex littledalei TaxID=544730 RepID=A0A833QRH5_9POAL|nr:WD and tetratricopeptide repeats protein 1 isoform X2 [Carex littledalei]